MRVLIVEDNDPVISSVELALRGNESPLNKLVIDCCHSAPDAKARLTETLHSPEPLFNIITIDLEMQGDLFAGLKLCDFILKKMLSVYKQREVPLIGILYSRYLGLYGDRKVWSETEENHVKNKIEFYKKAGVLHAAIVKELGHANIRDFIIKNATAILEGDASFRNIHEEMESK